MKTRIVADMKEAMKAKDKDRLSAVRLILSQIKQVEVDERRELSDEDIIGILNTMLKQRRESAKQYAEANRTDLVDKEEFEISIIQSYLPEAMSADAISALIDEVIAQTGASGPQDMGKVMGAIKPKAHGRADMSQVSQAVKAKLVG